MADEPRSLHGKVAAITGGARGIGKATAAALAREGMRVAIGDLDRELAERTAAEIGGETLALELDVTDRDSFAAFIDQVSERLGSLDVLVNNAGIMPLGPFVDEDDATTRRIIDINLWGVLHGMKLALPGMRRRGVGHIVNIASQAGKIGLPGGATYAASKHAVVGISEAVRAENLDAGIDVSWVMPNVVNTELGRGTARGLGVRVVEPEDVAEAIVSELKRPRFEVWVPRSGGPLFKFGRALPRRWAEALGRALGATRVLAEADPAARAAYHQRAARSEPGLEPGSAEAEKVADAAEAPR
ncbi:MAG TPA: SDR family oxidoreductase [Solirubrobacterales bacterium]|nr:SDR family oxidoreductase [Solirubrobacterales bacterium]